MPAHHHQLHAADLVVERGGRRLLDGVTLTIAPGDRLGLLGPNGAGKSSLLAVLAGDLSPTAGTVQTVGEDTTIGLLDQEPGGIGDESVADHLARRTGVAAAAAELDAATEALTASTDEALERHHRALQRWLSLGSDDLDQRVVPTLAAVGLADGARLLSQPVATLSGGERSKVGLAAVLLARHDVLLLDEPTNNLDTEGLALLEADVRRRSGPVVLVSHDRRFLEAVVTAVFEIDPYTATAQRHEGTYAAYLEARAVAAGHARRRYDDYVTERDRLRDRAQTQRRWAAKGLRAERNPPDNDRVARGMRIERTEKQASKARATERALDRLEAVDKPWEPWRLEFSIGSTERAGDRVADLHEAVVDRGRFRLGPITLDLGAGERLVVVGGNGAGKTTLVRSLFGLQPLTSGSHHVGPGTRLGWLGQDRQQVVSFDPRSGPSPRTDTGDPGDPGDDGDGGHDGDEGTALDWLVATTGLAPQEARSTLAKFGLGAEHLSRPRRRLSPGERTRLVLASFQAGAVNTLVLDEPTNHLDLEAITQLEQALDRFVGTVVLVTHDRAFLDATSLTRRITLTDGRVVADEAL
ncbi:MAG: ABC-F family ATP-binding cassette domain-containing protein [Actinomycetota bacterium]